MRCQTSLNGRVHCLISRPWSDILHNFILYGITTSNVQQIFMICIADDTMKPLVIARGAVYYILTKVVLSCEKTPNYLLLVTRICQHDYLDA